MFTCRTPWVLFLVPTFSNNSQQLLDITEMEPTAGIGATRHVLPQPLKCPWPVLNNFMCC